MIKPDTALEVYKRARRQCENEHCLGQKNLMYGGGELHHNYYRSQYRMDDRDESWNLSLLCAVCHRDNKYGVHGRNKKLRKELQRRSDEMKPPEVRSTTLIQRLDKKVKQDTSKLTYLQKERNRIFARERRQSKIEIFKAHHDGLTPSQYSYQQQKQYKQECKAILSSKLM